MGLGPGGTRTKTPTLSLQSSHFRGETVQNVLENNAAHAMVKVQMVPWWLKRSRCYVPSVEVAQRKWPGQLNGEVRSGQERNQGEGAFKVAGGVKGSRERGEKMNCVRGMAEVTMAGTSWRSRKSQAC